MAAVGLALLLLTVSVHTCGNPPCTPRTISFSELDIALDTCNAETVVVVVGDTALPV